MNDTKKIILEAATIDSAEERAAYLVKACGPDVELRRHIEAILADDHSSPGDPPDGAGENCAPDDESASEATVDFSNVGPSKPKDKISLGPYRLMEKIGEGGMGVIYVAEQREPVSRRVAIKVIKPGADTKEVIARFNAERQALAMMDHPNIARVFDAGETPEGRPYFVMELVKGIPVTKFCDRNRLSSRERLELFIDVCHAIQHAHQKGIIHRDIKPNNVLVTSHDGKAVVKVIDFGVAKAINQRLTDQTVYTKFSQVVGTPLYMSPEQAEMSGLDIDTRSDIYSLGVLLYELLTGSTPHDRARLKKAAYDEMRRIIREEEPQRPSTKISTLGDTALSVSESRGTDPKRLTNILRGDLDWIVMKAMEKDRTRRYETANGFALDVKRFLDDEPVLASPPSAAYRIQKMIHRNRGAFAALAAIVAILIIGAGGTTFGMVSAMTANATIRQKNSELDKSNQQLADANTAVQNKNAELAASNARETEARNRAERVKEFLVDAFRKTDPTREGQMLTVAEVLRRSVDQLETDLEEDKRTQADLLAAIGRSFSGLGLYEESLEVFQRESKLRSKIDGPSDRPKMLADHRVGYALYQNGRYQEAIETLRDVIKRQEMVLGENDTDTLSSMGSLADCYMALNRSQEAMDLFQEIVTKRTEYLGEDHQDTLSAKADLAMAHQRLGNFDQALKIAEENLAKHEELFGEDHPLTLGAIGRLASIHTFRGKFELSIPLYRKAFELREAKLGPKHPLTLSSKSGLGIALRDAGKLNDSLKTLDEVLAVRREELGMENHSTLSSANNVARVYLELGRYSDALPLIEECYQKHRELSGRKSKATVDAMNTLGMTYFYAGRPRDALPIFAELLEIQAEVLGEDNPTTISITNNLAMAHQFVGELDKALPLMQRAFEWRSENLGEDHPKTLVSQQNLGSILRGVGRLEDSITVLEATVPLHQKKLGKPHRQTVAAMSGLANAYVQRGDYLKALRLAQETLDASLEAVGEEHPDTMRSMNSVGIAALGCGFVAEANEMFARTLELRRKKLGEGHSFTIQSTANLAMGLLQADDTEKALKLAREAREAANLHLKEDAPVAMNVSFTLGRAYLSAKQYDEAEDVLTKLLKQRRETVGDDHPNTWKAQHYLGKALFENGVPVQAAPFVESALAGRAGELGDASVSTINSRLLLAKCRRAQQKYDEAESLLKQVWEHLPAVDEQTFIPNAKKYRINAAQGYLDLYEAWDKQELADTWKKRVEQEQERETVSLEDE